MFKVAENTNSQSKVRQNQINELKNILEEDKVDVLIAEQLAIDLEQAAFNLSGGENTREYRTRMNTVKMRLKGIKGQWIRVIILDQIMTPSELMQLDMQKFNEETVQAFLIQNNRAIPSKQSFVKKQLPPHPTVQQPAALQNEIQNVQSNEKSENGQKLSNQKLDQVVSQNMQFKFQPIGKEDTFQNSNEIDKFDFTPQEEPIRQFEDLGDYSFEINQKQSGFIEKNDIEELQLHQQNLQQEEEIMRYQIGSPLPSDNALNQEFLQDELQDEIKQNNLNRILDSQIQLEEQFYYDHQCSFQAKNENTDYKIDNNQVLSTFGQDNRQQEEDPQFHTHQLQQCIQQRILEQEHQTQIIKEPITKENFQEYILTQDEIFTKKIKQLTQAQKELQGSFIQIQQAHNEELQQQEQQSIINENNIQILRNESNLIKQQLQYQEQSINFQMNTLKEFQQFQRSEFSKILEKQKNQIKNDGELFEQIQFNSNLRREQHFKFQDSNQEMNLDEQMNAVQDILLKLQSKRLLTNQQTNQQEQFQTQNSTQQPIHHWEEDGVVQGTLLNADSGSTQIRRIEQTNQQQDFEEQELNQQEEQAEEFQPQQVHNDYDQFNGQVSIEQRQQQNNNQIENNQELSTQLVDNQQYTEQKKQKNKSQRQKHDNVPQSLFD